MKKIIYPVTLSRVAVIFADTVCVGAGYMIASLLILIPVQLFLGSALLHALFIVIGLYVTQSYRILWRYATVQDFYRIVGGFAVGAVMLAVSGVFIVLPDTIFLFVAGFNSLMFLLASRVAFREITAQKAVMPEMKSKILLIAGAGEAGTTLLAEFKRNGRADGIIGFVDDDVNKIGTLLCGKPVVGTTHDIPEIAGQHRVQECIIAMPSAPHKEIDRVIRIIRSCNNVTISILPSVTRIFERALTPELRGIGVEELIGREEIHVESTSIEKYCMNRAVLVTGAGGSIGSELCRQLLHFKAKRIIAVGRGEHSMYNLKLMMDDYSKYFDKPDIQYYIADINDAAQMNRIFKAEMPDTVFHAAAHKYVDIMEMNPQEAVSNNCLGTRTVLEAAKNSGVKQFVCISTDKAVSPVSVMGATKRMAEIISLAYNSHSMNTCCVRFGNVIGSRGSVIPLFYQQIAKGGPVTITHPEMTRYFMSIPEAVMLVINASVLSAGGEIFVLDMGMQYNVEGVARNLIRLLGYDPDVDIPIMYTGIRPGEKLHEDLWNHGEELKQTNHKKIFSIAHNGYEELSVTKIKELNAEQVQSMTGDECRSLIRSIVAEYTPYRQQSS